MNEVVIVGGGIIGLLTARELSLSGRQVIVIDQGPVAQESSWAGGGILSPLYPWRWSEGITQLALQSQNVYPNLCDELREATGIDPQWIKSGLLILGTAEQEQARQWSEKNSVFLQQLNAQEVLQVEPLVCPSDEALFFPDVGQVRNPRLSKSVKAWLQEQGVTLLENQKVVELVAKKNRISSVITAHERINAEYFVIAGGAWSRTILLTIGIEIDVQPVKGQMIMYQAPSDLISRIILSEDRYIIPRKDGNTLVGSTLEQAAFDKQVSSDARTELAGVAQRIVPLLANYPIINHWSGLRPGTHRETPYICRHPELENLFINTGHFRNGVVTAPASAALITRIINSSDPILGSEAFAL